MGDSQLVEHEMVALGPRQRMTPYAATVLQEAMMQHGWIEWIQ
jgi:hypothetical protein